MRFSHHTGLARRLKHRITSRSTNVRIPTAGAIAVAAMTICAACASGSSEAECSYPVLPFRVDKADYFQKHVTECPLGATNLESCVCPSAKSAATYCMSVKMTPMWTHGQSSCTAIYSDNVKEGTIDSKYPFQGACAYVATVKTCASDVTGVPR